MSQLRSHLLRGVVRHRRTQPMEYELEHDVFYLALDLDEIVPRTPGTGRPGTGPGIIAQMSNNCLSNSCDHEEAGLSRKRAAPVVNSEDLLEALPPPGLVPTVVGRHQIGQHERALVAVGDVEHPEADQIAGSELTIDRQGEERPRRIVSFVNQ